MEAFVAANQLVAETKARHESTFLEPKDGAEGAQEEDAFDCGKGDDSFGKDGVGRGAPFESPTRFAFHAWYCFNGAEEVQFLLGVLNVRVN